VSTRFLRLLLVMLTAVSSSLYAQSGSSTTGGFDLDKLLSGAQNKSTLESQRLDQTAYDNVVQPEFYYVGPGDVLTLLKLDATSMDESIVVSPESMIFIPRLGAINVAGKTLAQVRDTVLALQRERTPSLKAFLGLKRPRLVYVTVRGNVLSPGMYSLPASTRVLTVLKMAMQMRSQVSDVNAARNAAQVFGQTESTTQLGAMRQRRSLLPASVMRNIVVRHSDRTVNVCDLHKAEVSSVPTDDPYIREGDEIYVPAEIQDYGTMTVTGGVSNPTTTIVKAGDKISFLCKLGGFCTNLAKPAKAVLVRNGERIDLDVDQNLNLLSGDREAMSGDVVIVDEEDVAPISLSGSVSIRGEIEKPGMYAVTNHKTRLKDIVDLAGGVRGEAYLPLAHVLRREKSESSYMSNEYVDRLKKMQNSNLLLEDTTRFTIDEIGRKPLVACNFERALSSPGSEDNVTLQDGDVIVIPRNPRTVYVYGQVRSGGYFNYVPGRTMEQYIALAGGMTTEADKGRERIIKGKTGVWLKAEETPIEAGDKIYVPHPPDEPLGQQIQRTASYVTIAAAIVNALFLAINIYITLSR
jgi:polysaccharide export outer membrane protein